MRGAHRRLDPSMRKYWWWWAGCAAAGFFLILVGCTWIERKHIEEIPKPTIVIPSKTHTGPPDADWIVKRGTKCVVKGQTGVAEDGRFVICRNNEWRKK